MQLIPSLSTAGLVGVTLGFAILLTGQTLGAPPPEGKDGQPKEPAKGAKVEVRPILASLWKKSTVGLPAEDDFNAEVHKPIIEWLAGEYRGVTFNAQRLGRPLVPPAVPVAEESCVYYANDQAVVLRCLCAGFEFGDFRKAGDVLWVTERDSG